MRGHDSTGDGPHDGHSRDHGVASTSSRKLAAVSAVDLVGFLAELAGFGVDHAIVELHPAREGRGTHLDSHGH